MNVRFLLLLLTGLSPVTFAQNDSEVPAAPPGTAEQASGLPEGSAAAVPKKDSAEMWNEPLLRDPFWPIGFFPKDWQEKPLALGVPDLGGSGWKSAAGKIRISGASRLGGRTAAIINGELKSVGEQIEVLHEGKTYQWEIVEIAADGRVELKKLGIR